MKARPVTCETCRFGTMAVREWLDGGGLWTNAKTIREDVVLCRRYPKQVTKQPSDFCGEHSSSPPVEP